MKAVAKAAVKERQSRYRRMKKDLAFLDVGRQARMAVIAPTFENKVKPLPNKRAEQVRRFDPLKRQVLTSFGPKQKGRARAPLVKEILPEVERPERVEVAPSGLDSRIVSRVKECLNFIINEISSN